MTKGQIVKVVGVSQKGKNRIRENGNEWEVIAGPQHVRFDSGEHVLLAPKGHDKEEVTVWRWVKVNEPDKDFAFVVE